MKKKLKWIAIAIVAIFIILVIIGLLSGQGKKSFEKGLEQGKNTVEQAK